MRSRISIFLLLAMFDLTQRFALALWEIFVESSLYILVGFAIAGLLHVWVPETLIQRFLGRGRVRSIFTAAFLGIPLPLCSCSVLPTAIAMRRMGASRGATVSYLISEPETGPDSIAITYGLMGPVMAVYRPVAALLAAIVAGLIVELRGGPDHTSVATLAADASHGEASAQDQDSCGHEGHDHDPAPPFATADASSLAPAQTTTTWWRRALRYGFVDLLDDLSPWLLLGMVIGAMVSAFVPESFVRGYLGHGPLPLVVMALIGVPIYICASASTPIAAALMLKGLSPGAALVFLLTGPATNLGSIVVLVRYLGRRVVAIYLGAVVVVSIAMGAALDLLFAALGSRPAVTLGAAGQGWLPATVWNGAAMLFIGMIGVSLSRAPTPPEFVTIGRWVERATGFGISRGRLAIAALGFTLASWLGTGLLVVGPGELGAVVKLGRLQQRDVEPGLHAHAPAPVARAVIFPVGRSLTLELGVRAQGARTAAADGARPRSNASAQQSTFLTGDANAIDLRLAVEYQVVDAAAFGFGVANPGDLIGAVTRAAVVEVLGRYPVDAIYTEARRSIEREIWRAVQRDLDRYGAGVGMTRVSLLDVHAPAPVHPAFRDLASAQQDALAAAESARGYAEEVLPRARGEAVRERLAAESAGRAEVARASSEAEAFTLQAAAVTESRDVTPLRLYLESVEEVLPGVRKVIRPESAPEGSLELWLSSGP